MISKAPDDVQAAAKMHDLRSVKTVHDNLNAHDCSCDPRNGVEKATRTGGGASEPVQVQKPKQFFDTGEACLTCGGLTVRTGTCTTCTSCGSTSGCG